MSYLHKQWMSVRKYSYELQSIFCIAVSLQMLVCLFRRMQPGFDRGLYLVLGVKPRIFLKAQVDAVWGFMGFRLSE